MGKSIAEAYKEGETKVIIWNYKVTKFHSKYPILGKELDWDFAVNYSNGFYKGCIEEELFRVFEHIESYSKWRKIIQDEFDHQKVESISIRIKQLQLILDWFENNKETQIVIIAEKEMMPGLLLEKFALEKLLVENTVNEKRIVSLDDSNKLSASSSINTERISQSNLVYILHDTFENFQKIREEFSNDTEIARILYENFEIHSNAENPITALNRAIPYKPKRKPKFDTKPIVDKLLQLFSHLA